MTASDKSWRMPAEWEEQDGVLIAWPHPDSDWSPILDQVVPMFAEIASAISRFERLIILAPDCRMPIPALQAAGANPDRITIVDVPTNDTWARDFGPISVSVDGKPHLLDFGFNGWGGKFPAELDNNATSRLTAKGIWQQVPLTIQMIFEGGSIESDGAGTLLTTAQCLLNPNRNPELSKDEIERQIAELLGTRRILWLHHGHLAGDDTDAHIDTLARLCPDDTIVYVSCADPTDEHFAPLAAMQEELAGFRTASGQPYRLLPLPLPAACYDENNERLPATYANYLVINGAVLVPTYHDPQDEAALAVIQQAFPRHEIIGIDCRQAVRQHGSLHCLTMQLPKGVLQ